MENAHKFSAPIGMVPIPTMRLKTADDEVKADAGDKAAEVAAEVAAWHGEVNGYEAQGTGAQPQPDGTHAAPDSTADATPAAPPLTDFARGWRTGQGARGRKRSAASAQRRAGDCNHRNS
jgi:hypothetical protein